MKLRLFSTLSRILIIVIVILSAAEILSRVFLGSPPQPIDATLPDNTLNHTWKPNLAYRDFSRSTPFMMYTNSQSWIGRRDVPLRKPKNTIRIFYVGDSNTQGVVAEGKKMVNIVEKGLNERFGKNGKSIEVIDTGTTSWSPSIYYLEIKDQIMRYSPDIVVIDADMTDCRDDSVYRKLTVFDKKGLPVAIRPSKKTDKSQYVLAPQGIVKVSPMTAALQQFHQYLTASSSFYFHYERFAFYLPYNLTLRRILHKPPPPTNFPPIEDGNWLALAWSKNTQINVDYTLFLRALLRVGGGLHLHLKQSFEGAIDPGKSQV
jgi:hypothetical protein